MPRVIRDSDEEVESKSSTRRTRASSAASVTDSPARRTTRRNKQLAVIESSPESLDDSTPQPAVRTTRSRAATLDKSAAAGIAKNLRSRKNSVSSNLSETIDLESETIQKRVTRKAAVTAAVVGTPTKASLRSRNLRAGSEAASTPPATRSTRVTRASSVDPFNTPNEPVGTPVKRRTRASIAPIQQTVTEEQESQNKSSESLNNTVAEVDEDSENESVSTKGKSNDKNITKSRKKTGKDTSTEQSNMDTSRTIEGNMTDRSCVSTHDRIEEPILKPLASHTDTSALDFFASKDKENTENINSINISESLVSNKIEEIQTNSHINNDSVKVDVNDDECEHIDVENFTLTDDSIDVVNSPKKVDFRETLALDMKDAYVKLNRTNLVEKVISDKLEEVKNDGNNLHVKTKDSVNQSNVITNAKTAIVLVNDFVKSNEYFNSMKDKQIFDSGISLNNREDVNSNTSVHNSDDDQISIATIEDNDDVLSLKLSSPNKKETDDNKLITEALPDDEKNYYFSKNTDESVSVEENSDSVPNCSLEKSDICLKGDVVPESKLESVKIIVNEKNSNSASLDEVQNVVHNEVTVEIGDENNLISDNTKKMDTSEVINTVMQTKVNSSSLQKSLCDNDSVSMGTNENPIISVNEKSSLIEVDLKAVKSNDDSNNEIIVNSEVVIVCDSSTKSKVALNENTVREKNELVDVIASCNSAEIADMSSVKTEKSVEAIDTKEQLESMNMSISDSNSNESRNFSCATNQTNSNEIEPKLSLKDKNGLPSAVTDADGEDASRPTEDEESHESSTNTASSKSPEKTKRKSKTQVIDSDLDESAENLFQDIPAEEWSEEHANESKIITEDGDSRNKSKRNSIDKSKSLSNKELDSREADAVLPKKHRKSLERKRESGQSSDSGIQDGNSKTVVENDGSDNEMNESCNKSRRSLDKSLKANQSSPAQSQNESIAEKSLSKSLIDVKSSGKSRKSLNNSIQFNVSVFNSFRKTSDSISEQESTAASNTSSSASQRQSLSDKRKSIAQENLAENSRVEEMDVDDASNSENEKNKANGSPIKSRKSLNKSQVDQSLVNEDNVASKRLSLDKSLNKSSRKSLAEQQNEEQVVVDEEIDDNVVESNKSVAGVAGNKSFSKGQSSFNESPALTKNNSFSENCLSTSLNESKKLKKRLSTKLNESATESPAKKRNEKEESDSEEMEVDVVSDNSPEKTRKSLNKSSSNKSIDQTEQPIDNAESQVSFKNTDKSPKKTHDRKSSANKSLPNASNIVVDDDQSESEVEPREDLEKSNNKKDLEKSDESVSEDSPEKKKKQETESVSSALDRSLQKSIERMKYSNPVKHDISTVVQVNSSSEEDDSDDSQIPNFMFKLSDEEETEDSSDEEEKEENEMDSDIDREYNLGGKNVTKYSDDDVPGDDCRASEEESSDVEDDGADLDDFVVPDAEVDDDDDDGEEEEDDENEGDDDNDEDEDEENEDEDKSAEGKSSNTSKLNISKANVSVNSLQSILKNSSKHLQRSGFSQSSGSESNDEVEYKKSKKPSDYLNDSEKLLNDSKKLKQQSIALSKLINDQNTILQKKNESLNKSSKSAKVSATCSEDSEDESQMQIKENSINISAKNKSLNASKSRKDLSQSNRDESAAARLHESCKSGKNKSVLIVENGETEESSSESEREETRQVNGGKYASEIASPSDATSESEDGEDYYCIANGAETTTDTSVLKSKSKKLIDCSTPKPGSTAKKSGLSKVESLSITASRRKSGSLNDLSDTKAMSSRLSIGEVTAAASKSMKFGDTSMKLKEDVEIVATPETATKMRQAWKLIPLNQTAHPALEDTPATKFLKKAKLNDSFPVLESMKSSSDLAASSSKKAKKPVHASPVAVAAQLPEELAPKRDKSKKRKLLDMSNVQSLDDDSILKLSKKSKKRARFDDSTLSAELEQPAEEVQNGKKKRKNRAQEQPQVEVDDVEEKPKKKKNKKSSQAQEDEVEKPKSKKSKTASLESETKKKAKKSAAVPQDSGDEAPESLGFEEGRRLALAQEAAERTKPKKKRREQPQQQQQQPRRNLKRLPEDILENLTDEPLRRPDKRQKLSRNQERSVIMPSQSMFSPGKSRPDNLRVDDAAAAYIPLSSAGGTTQFAVVNLKKAKKVAKKSATVLSFRDRMLARNKRMPTSVYLSYLKKQKAKGSS